MIGQFLAKQFKNPSGWLAGTLLPRLWNRRNAALNNLTLACLELSPNDTILEVGCGGGYLLEIMAREITSGKLAGVDISTAMLAHCRQRSRKLVRCGILELHQARAEKLPFDEATFNHACTVNTIFYFSHPTEALTELRRVLSPGGRAAVTFTCLEDLIDRPFARHGLNLFTEQQVVRLMESVGFSNIQLHKDSDRHRSFVCVLGLKM
jgi:ubiquinone/menaquinone biosynthesis C-methylase UbiE